MNPCVKFYQNIIQWKWFRVPEMVQLIMYYVCKADHEPYNVDGVRIERGQVCITRKNICSELDMSEQTFKTCMKRLIADGKVSTDNGMFRHTIVTVSNYSRYVVEDSASAKVSSSPQPCQPAIVADLPKEDAINVVEVQPAPSSSLFSDDVPAELPVIEKKEKKDVDCDFILKLYHDRCPSLPKVLKLTDKRKMKIRVRFEEMKYSFETLQEVFDRIEASFFMRGDNKRGWRADFDWIFANSQNWVKVLEGKYDNNNNSIYVTNGTATIPTATAGFATTQPDRNTINSARQKCDILNTLAKCQQDYDSGNLPTLTCSEEQI